MFLSKIRLILVLLPTIAIVSIYITATGHGFGRNEPAESVRLPSVVVDGAVGGLGNQLFRYAFAYTLAAQLKTDLFVEVNASKLLKRTFDSWRREFVLDFFQIPFNAQQFSYTPAVDGNEDEEEEEIDKYIAPRVEFLPPKSITNIPAHRKFVYTETNYQHRDPVPRDRVIVVGDYWESEVFFAPQKWELLNQFQFNVTKIAKLINKQEKEKGKATTAAAETATPSKYERLLRDVRSSESVAVHFRIGDFNSKSNSKKSHNVNHVLPTSFQLRAMRVFSTLMAAKEKKQYKFFIFSDDIEYVRAAVDFSIAFDTPGAANGSNLVFVSPDIGGTRNSMIEFYIMTQCKNFVVPNSTYSWWAAYLARHPGKTVFAACPKNNASYYDKYEDLNVRAYKKMLGTNILYANPRNWYSLNPYEKTMMS